MSEQYDDYLDQASASNRRVAGLVIAGITVIAAAMFILQNTKNVEVTFLFFSRDAALYIVIVISMVLGALLTLIVLWFRRRSKKRKQPGDE